MQEIYGFSHVVWVGQELVTEVTDQVISATDKVGIWW